MCEMVVGDRLKGLKGVVRLEKGDKQADCQQSSASGNENGERQGRNEDVMLRHGLKQSLKRSTRSVARARGCVDLGQ